MIVSTCAGVTAYEPVAKPPPAPDPYVVPSGTPPPPAPSK